MGGAEHYSVGEYDLEGPVAAPMKSGKSALIGAVQSTKTGPTYTPIDVPDDDARFAACKPAADILFPAQCHVSLVLCPAVPNDHSTVLEKECLLRSCKVLCHCGAWQKKNPCAGQNPDLPGMKCVINGTVAAVEQSGINLTEGFEGTRDTEGREPITTTFSEA